VVDFDLQKVKAHRDAAGITDDEKLDFDGNHWADENAKAIARQACCEFHHDVSAQFDVCKALLRSVARKLACWPSGQEMRRAYAMREQARSCGRVLPVHEFVASRGGGFLCVSCGLHTKKRKSLLSSRLCWPMCSHVVVALHKAQQLGHRMCKFVETPEFVHSEHARPFYACKCCGRHAVRQFRGLHDKCLSHKSNSWRRIFIHGKHPRSGIPLLLVGDIRLPEVWDPAMFDVQRFMPAIVKMHELDGGLSKRRNRHDCLNLDDSQGSVVSESD
jgi:hypothetical protein